MKAYGDTSGLAAGPWIFGLVLLALAGIMYALWGEVPKPPASSTCGVEGELAWPLGAPGPKPLGQNYLQYQGSGGLHVGLDIMASPGDEVLAVESGTVRNVSEQENISYEVLVESDASPEEGFVYAHLAWNTLQVGVGDPVDVGTHLGDVNKFDLENPAACPDQSDCYDHLHLERNEVVSGEGDWTKGPALANPLSFLEGTQDDAPPCFEKLSTAAYSPHAQTGDDCVPEEPYLAFCKNEQPLQVRCPESLVDGEAIDVIACIVDRPGGSSPWENAPYCTVLTIRPVRQDLLFSHLRFENRYAGAWQEDTGGQTYTYVRMGEFKSVGTAAPDVNRKFYVFLTNETFEDGSWVATAFGGDTDYTITAEVFDSAGNRSAVTTTVTVRSSSS